MIFAWRVSELELELMFEFESPKLELDEFEFWSPMLELELELELSTDRLELRFLGALGALPSSLKYLVKASALDI
jgi:hypothetical protein